MNLLPKLEKPFQYVGVLALFLGMPYAIGNILADGNGALIIMLVMVAAIVFFAGVAWLVWNYWKKGKGKAFAEAMKKNSAHGGSHELESIRNNFAEGLEKLRAAGKNVYDIPWFLIAGQTGAGKTEAIRRSHSKEDFPAGLNDFMQGVGGTLNMNWWFTNRAIILDTAGRIFEERVASGEGGEWLEFLRMLKKARRQMPINGFILAIPADSLICDDLNTIEKKASHIAMQLKLVQDTLGVRFPVFVLVTKTDFIPGFREFVENLKEPRLQHQMLGWSNPQNLDEPFNPDFIDRYLEGVVEKLKKRRLTYMLDPRPQLKKRLDEVDSLFSFPNQLVGLVPSLRRYLEIVFAINPWSQKPLFIRGIYFTSSLQQGEALDEALAAVLGKSLEKMALTPFKKEVPLFLRDAFFTKIYKEWGLVTAASKVSATMRKRAVALGLVCFLGLFGILGAAWFGAKAFREEVGQEYVLWAHAASELNGGGERPLSLRWRQPIVFDPGTGFQFTSNLSREFIVGGDKMTLPQYLNRLARYCEQDLSVPTVFKPLRMLDDIFSGERLDRRQAFRIIFESAIIFPILENAKEKLRMIDAENWEEDDLNGLRAAIRFQLLLNNESRGRNFSRKLFIELNKLHEFLVDKSLGPEIESMFERYFGDAYIASSGWPSGERVEIYAPAVGLEDRRLAGVTRGLEIWAESIKQRVSIHVQKLKETGEVLKDYENLIREEAVLYERSFSSGYFNETQLEAIRGTYQALSSRIKVGNSFKSGDEGPLLNFYEEKYALARSDIEEKVNDFLEELESSVKARGGRGGIVSGDNPESGSGDRLGSEEDSFINQLIYKVREISLELERRLDSAVEKGWGERMNDVDQVIYSGEGLIGRLEVYSRFSKNLSTIDALNISSRAEAKEIVEKVKLLGEQVGGVADKYNGQLEHNVRQLGVVARSKSAEAIRRIVEAYYSLALEELASSVGFPIVKDGERELNRSQVNDLRSFLAGFQEEIRTFLLLIEDLEQNKILELLIDAKKVEEFIKSNLTPEIIEEGIRLEHPPIVIAINHLGQGAFQGPNAVLRQSVLWRSRFIKFGEAGHQRIGGITLMLGQLPLDSSTLEISFMSVIDGETGDSGRFLVDKPWAPLRLYLTAKATPHFSMENCFQIVASAIGSDGLGRPFSLTLRVPKDLPSPAEWLMLEDLSSLRRK